MDSVNITDEWNAFQNGNEENAKRAAITQVMFLRGRCIQMIYHGTYESDDPCAALGPFLDGLFFRPAITFELYSIRPMQGENSEKT